MTSEIEEFDDTENDEDEWETPTIVFDMLCGVHHIFPELDVSADKINTKCPRYFTKEDNALFKKWLEDAWCNHPHSKTEEFVNKCQHEWEENNINILMIVPANAIGAHYFDYVFDNNCATYHRISGRINFTQHGIKKSSSRNGYFSVVWRKRNKVKVFDDVSFDIDMKKHYETWKKDIE